MRLRKHTKGDVDTYTRKSLARDRKGLLNELRILAKSKDPEEAHASAEMYLLEYLNDEEIAQAYSAVPKWYA